MKMLFLRFGLVFLCLTFLLSMAGQVSAMSAQTTSQGSTYYLATNGSDSNQGSLEAPFGTFLYAVQQLQQPGDTLLIRGGDYVGYSYIIGKGSSDGPPISIKNYQNEKVSISNHASGGEYVLFIGNNSHNVRVSGLTLSFGGAAAPANAVYVLDAYDVVLDRLEVFNAYSAAIINQSGNFVISNNIVHDTTGDNGGFFFLHSPNGSVYNNVIYRAPSGLQFMGQATQNIEVYNNTFWDNGVDVGLYSGAGMPSHIKFRNNIFSSPIQNTDNFIAANDFDYNLYNHSLISGSVTTGGEQLTFAQLVERGIETHGVWGEPRYANPNSLDFRLQTGSDAIGMGTYDRAPTFDIVGEERKGGMDAGAYAFNQKVEYFVSPNGSDSNSGRENAPFQTMQKAISAVRGGGRILVAGGQYDEAIELDHLVNVTIQKMTADPVFILKPISITAGNNVLLDGLTSAVGVTVTGSDQVKLMRLNTASILVANSNGTILDSNVVHEGAGSFGVTLDQATGTTIANNVIRDQSGGGLLLKGSAIGNWIINNTFFGNNKDAILESNESGIPQNNKYLNNIFTAKFDIASETLLASNSFNYNLFDQVILMEGIGTINGANTTFDEFKLHGQEQNGHLGKPVFINERDRDFRLFLGSEAIGTGTNEDAPAKDFLGYERQTPYDIGAFSYTVAQNSLYIAPNGSDHNAGTHAAPFQTIQHGIDMLRPGETLIVTGGTYHETVQIRNKQGFSYSYYQVKAASGEAVVLSGENQYETGMVFDGSSSWHVEGIQVRNYTKTGITVHNGSSQIELGSIRIDNVTEQGVAISNSDHIRLNQIMVTGVNTGVVVDHSTDWKMEKLRITHSSDAAVTIESSSKGSLNTSIIDGGQFGVRIAGGSDSYLYNNTFYGNAKFDLLFEANTQNITAKNNIFGSVSSQAAIGAGDEASSHSTLDYNLYNKQADDPVMKWLYVSQTSTFSGLQASGHEAKGQITDPMFVDTTNSDYHLRSGSLAAGAGIEDSNSPSNDYEGTLFLSPIDVGAFYTKYSNKQYYVASNGDDNNDGSLEKPWKTIKYGMNRLRQSDTLFIRGGIYSERVDISTKNGTPETVYTVKNYPGEVVVLDSSFDLDVAFKISNSSYWKIEGLKITKYTGAGVWFVGGDHFELNGLEISEIADERFTNSGTEAILGNSGYVTVKNSYLHHIGLKRYSPLDHGAYIGYGAHNWTFTNNRIEHVPGAGIQMYGAPVGGDDVIIDNNTFAYCYLGIDMYMGQRNLVSNNSFYNNWGDDVHLDSTESNSIVQNNIFYNDLPIGMQVKVEDQGNRTTKLIDINPTMISDYSGLAANNIFRNNVMQHKTFQQYLTGNTALVLEKMGIVADPLFVDAANGDYRLLPNSPAINFGTPDLAPIDDKTGTLRLPPPDAGAYEFLDVVAPITTSLANPVQPDGQNGWYVYPVSVSLRASDQGQGVEHTEYRVNDGTWTTYNGSITISEDGIYTLDYRSADKAGNVEPYKTIVIKLDQTAPKLTFELDKTMLWPPNHKMVTIHATLNSSDQTSDIASVVLSSITSNEPDSGQGDIQANFGTAALSFDLRAERLGEGTGRIYTITYAVTDNAGNRTTTKSTVKVPHNH